MFSPEMIYILFVFCSILIYLSHIPISSWAGKCYRSEESEVFTLGWGDQNRCPIKFKMVVPIFVYLLLKTIELDIFILQQTLNESLTKKCILTHVLGKIATFGVSWNFSALFYWVKYADVLFGRLTLSPWAQRIQSHLLTLSFSSFEGPCFSFSLATLTGKNYCMVANAFKVWMECTNFREKNSRDYHEIIHGIQSKINNAFALTKSKDFTFIHPEV